MDTRGKGRGHARSLFVVILAFLILLSSSIVHAAKVNDPNPALDSLLYTDPSLRVVETPVEASVIKDLPNHRAIESFRTRYGSAWHAIIDKRRGVVALMDGGAIPFIPGPANNLSWQTMFSGCSSASCIPHATLEKMARSFLTENKEALGIDPADLEVIPNGIQVAGHMLFINFRQEVSKIPVVDSAVWLRINNGNLIQIATEKVGPVKTATLPTFEKESAWRALINYLGKYAAAEDENKLEMLDRGSLILLPRTPAGMDPNLFAGATGTGADHFLAYRFAFRVPGRIATWEAFVDAHTGAVLAFHDANRYGTIRGGIYMTDGNPALTEVTMQFPYADYGTGVYADAVGDFPGTSGTSTMTGRTGSAGNVGSVDIVDTCGAISLASDAGGLIDFGTSTGRDCTTPGIGGAGNTHASRTQFWNVNKIKTKGYTYLPTNSWLQNLLTDNVNVDNTCNANWNGSSLNFYRSDGSSCGNAGEIPGVSMHEWGHGMDDNDGSGGNSPPVETRADWTAILQTHQSCAGGGFFLTGHCSGYGDACLTCTGIRDSNYAQHNSNTPWTPANNGQTPPGYSCSSGSYNGPCGWEDHCESGISTQALWDFVNRDLIGPPTNMDLTSAWQLSDRLFYTSMPTLGNMYTCTAPTSNGCGGGSLYTTMRAIDDDGDGTGNGTPHAAAIFAALNRHNIACGAAGDATNQNQTSCPPLTTPTLSAASGSGEVDLSWTTGGTNATKYYVFRNEIGCDAGYTKIGTVTAPGLTYTDTSIASGIPYYYRVQAIGANDSCASAMSNCAIPCNSPTLRIFLSSVVRDVSGYPVLTYTDPNDPTTVTGYNIYRASAPAGPWTLVGSNVSGLQWTDSSGDPGSFYYEVAAYNSGCGSEGPW